MPSQVRASFEGTATRLKRVAHKVGLEMVMPEMIPNSRRALEAAEYARERGQHAAFHVAVFRKLYGEGQNIGQWDVLRAVAEEVGLDPDVMQREVERGKYRATVDAHIAEARGLGITGVPTYILNDQYAIVGMQPYEVFQQAVAQMAMDTE